MVQEENSDQNTDEQICPEQPMVSALSWGAEDVHLKGLELGSPKSKIS